ncbi:MAG: class I SAM-dependent DNA methyltransferase [Phascolarctobacterium sp.]|nr:class I SAM-dependent DNA methyltransferase [Phascolarctobacterium sp.]
MNDVEQRAAAKKFVADWEGKGYEKGESQKFWIALLGKVFGVADADQYINFENRIKLDHTSFIDGYIESTKVLIEQKSLGKDLRAPIKQSDGSFLTPFQQAKRYASELAYSERPRWIVTCNFASFLVYDMERPNDEPQEILLKDLEKEYHRLSFLVKTNARVQKELEVSIKAGELIGKIYDAILKQYKDPSSEATLKSLNVLCVRLVFCMYAEDAGIFGERNMFLDYLREFDARKMRSALIELFKVLDTEEKNRDPYLDEELASFPYVNGGLFADESIEIPQFTDEIRELLLDKASSDFDWSLISPTIFGALFESTLNPETRRSGGMHYTSIENIHKVIDPLFLNELTAELESIKQIKVKKNKKEALLKYQDKLAGLTFLDPACGSGNFLTETYLALRHLENEALRELYAGEIVLGELVNPIKVSIKQFYGIEINDFAVTVAKTALWIAESQMMKETEDVIHMSLDFLPLKSYVNIVEGNALRIDWEDVVPKAELNYIMGNPPFVGTKLMSKEQKKDAKDVLGKFKSFGVLDYVACWYKKTLDYILGTEARCALVSTNSICQGEQVAVLWRPLFELGLHIDFAYSTFRWDSEASGKAQVHCVIVGFSVAENKKQRVLYDAGLVKTAKNINPYLVDAETVFVESVRTPLCNVQQMFLGCDFKDGDYYIFTEKEKEKFLLQEPQASEFIKPYMTGRDFINRKPRYCLWLNDANPKEIKKCPLVVERIRKVQEFRQASDSEDTKRYADFPMRPARLRYYSEERNDDYLALPRISSQNRRYLPMEIVNKETIGGASILMIPKVTLYSFGVLESNVHMAWMRTVCGRMKSDYRYSNGVVYNTFPWCNPTEAQRAKIEKTAQGILDARALYPDSSLADLYDEATMPIELRKAHRANDRAVMEAYGFWGKLNSESECVAELMKMYQKLVEE